MENGKGIFISHSSEDKQFARMLANHLSEYGLIPWLDETDMKVGDDLMKTIMDALKGTEYMAIVLSSHSIQSKWVKKEIKIAQLQEKKEKRTIIVPVLLDESVEIPLGLKGRLYADFTHEDMYHKGFHELLKLFGYHPEFQGKLIIYSNLRKIGWENWSWNCDCNEKSTKFIHSGQYSISAKLGKFGGLAFAFRSGINTKGYNKLEFYINGGDTGEQRLKVFMNVKLGNGIKNNVTLDPLIAKEWKLISIPLKDLDAQDTIIVKINFSDISGKNTAAFYLDDLSLVQ